MSECQPTFINTQVFNPNNVGFMKKRAMISPLSGVPKLYIEKEKRTLSIETMRLQEIKQINQVVEIIPGLFLGSASNVPNICNKIGAILNITHENSMCSHLDHSDIIYLSIPIDDTINQNILNYFDITYDFINRYIGSGIYVHCAQGISRSPTIVIAYLMRKNNIGLVEALSMVKSKRPCICPNIDFLGNLLIFEQKLHVNPI